MPTVTYAQVLFTGRVQGVGFRYQTLQVAKEFEVCGGVKNLPDGRVQLEVEGGASEVNDFIAAVKERMAAYIRKSERTASSRAAQFNDFALR